MLKNYLKNLNKKQKLGIFVLSIVLLSCLSITGVLPLASLYGGDSDNQYGGQFSASGIGLNGETTTSFAEISASQIDLEVTNNANDPYTISGQPIIKKALVEITSSGESTGQQVKIPINSLTGMNSDLSNVRFQLADGTNLPQWRESYVEDTSADYWVKTDLISDVNSIYMVYGGEIPLKSNLGAVMEVGDDFDGTTLNTDIWNSYSASGCSISISNGEVTFTTDSDTTGAVGIWSKTNYGANTIMESSFKFSDTNNHNQQYGMFGYGGYEEASANLYFKTQIAGDDTLCFIDASSANNNLYTRRVTDGILTEITSTGTISTSNKKFTISRDGTNAIFFIDDAQYGSSTTDISEDKPAFVGIDEQVGQAGDAVSMTVDYIFVRKTMATDPTISIGTPIDISDGTLDFTKMKTLTIDNTGGQALVNFPFDETIIYDSDMNADFSDVLFTETDGTIIPYYIVSMTESTTEEIQLKLSMDADSIKIINMYYGNPDIIGISDIYCSQSDFIIESFDGDSTGWTEVDSGSSLSFTNDRLTISTLSQQETAYVYKENTNLQGIDTRTLFTTSFTSVTYNPNYYVGLSDTIGMLDTSNNGYSGRLHPSGDNPNNDAFIFSSSTSYMSPSAGTISINNVYYCELLREGNTATFNIYNDAERTNQVSTSTITQSFDDSNIKYAYLLSSTNSGDTCTASGWIDDYMILPYISSLPSTTFGSEITLANPSITASCIGDNNEQVYGAEMKSFSLIPTSDISQFVIDGSINYDFDATVYYSGTTSVVENATEGTMSITFTPDITIEEGYANGIFTEDIAFEEYTMTATLDDMTIENVVFENNNTISAELINCDATEHVISVTITETIEEIPPSSGGSSGGGGVSTIATTELVENEENTTATLSEEKSAQITEFELFNTDSTTLMTYAAIAFLAIGMIYLISSRRK